MSHQGVADRSKITNAEVDAYLDLLRRQDNGRAFEDHARIRADPREA